MKEEEKIAKARKQLIISGIICVMAVILTLWIISLRNTLNDNKQHYTSPFDTVQKAQQQTGLWEQLKKILP